MISKRAALEHALRLIDTEGLESFTIRRLADEMNVNGASLYHHFANKDEILFGAARLAFADWRAVPDGHPDFESWLFEYALKYRRGLLAHPEIAPVLLDRHPLDIGAREIDETVRQCVELGIPVSVAMPLMEVIEVITLGSVLYRSATRPEDVEQWKDEYPYMYEASVTSALDDDERFEIATRAAISALVAAVRLKERNAAASQTKEPEPT